MFLAALLLALEPPSVAQTRGVDPWVCVERGRAEVVGEGAAATLGALGSSRRVHGRGELRLEACSSANVRWPARAGLELEGPADCAFDLDSVGSPRVTLGRFATAHVELREGPVELELAGGWRARLVSGVVALVATGSTGVRVERVVGEPLCFERVGSNPAHARRVDVRVGADGFLPLDPLADPASARVGGAFERAAVWPEFAWPWRESASEPLAPSPADFENALRTLVVERAERAFGFVLGAFGFERRTAPAAVVVRDVAVGCE
ncbi:MAG: hypothetical protein K8S98_09795 [Planctomycetes bacterium]|nr:hypothetical protein [Planctomycetota bacterium]